ncbi:MAG: hypothetical protein HYY44_01250, partial [Deltaproteobacteria bacterium]|nr:hypothetical protein [Deltaproteobacteria bacterium]
MIRLRFSVSLAMLFLLASPLLTAQEEKKAPSVEELEEAELRSILEQEKKKGVKKPTPVKKVAPKAQAKPKQEAAPAPEPVAPAEQLPTQPAAPAAQVPVAPEAAVPVQP